MLQVLQDDEVMRLLDDLHSDSAKRRWATCNRIAKLSASDERIVRTLENLATSDPVQYVREAAIAALRNPVHETIHLQTGQPAQSYSYDKGGENRVSLSAQAEQKDFIWTDEAIKSGFASIDVLATMRREWWAQARSEIMRELQKWTSAGWEPMTEVGPECWEVEESKIATASHWTPFQWVAFFIFLIPFFGLPLLFLFQKSTVYRPIAFRVPMRRQRPTALIDDHTSTLELLAQLGKLRDDGTITSEEFEAKKRELLAKI